MSWVIQVLRIYCVLITFTVVLLNKLIAYIFNAPETTEKASRLAKSIIMGKALFSEDSKQRKWHWNISDQVQWVSWEWYYEKSTVLQMIGLVSLVAVTVVFKTYLGSVPSKLPTCILKFILYSYEKFFRI